MYVLMDVEWYCGSGGRIFPTQLAALRTDESWNRRDRFFSRIRPDCTDTPNWTHIAFSGGEPEDFLCAPTLSAALRDLRMWLQMDDVLCWWAEEAPKVFKRLHTPLLQVPPAVPHRVLLDHVSPILISKGIVQENPCKIATSLGLTVPAPAHCSEHDVLTIQAVLQALDFPQENLRKQAKRRTSRYGSRQDPVHADMPYQLDTDTGLLHRKDCDDIPDGAVLSGFASFKPCFNGKAWPCPCLAEEYRSAKRNRNQSIIDRSQYNFVYAKTSPVFHRRDCRKLKGLSNLKGFSRFHDATCAGYTPCKLCKPTKKQDMIYSIPITSQKRQDESVQDLVALCEENQFTYSREAGYFTIRTPLGRWRIHLKCNPIAVDHINLTTTPDNPLLYHRQPRLFLSLADTFGYNKRHGRKLLEAKRQPLEVT